MDAAATGSAVQNRNSNGETPMTTEELVGTIRQYWINWLPEKVKDLRSEGTLEESIRARASLAHQRWAELVARGYQDHEADEVVLAEYVYLEKPEDGADADPELDAELEEIRAENREMARLFAGLSDSEDED